MKRIRIPVLSVDQISLFITYLAQMPNGMIGILDVPIASAMMSATKGELGPAEQLRERIRALFPDRDIEIEIDIIGSTPLQYTAIIHDPFTHEELTIEQYRKRTFSLNHDEPNFLDHSTLPETCGVRMEELFKKS